MPATPWRPRAWTASPTRSATSPRRGAARFVDGFQHYRVWDASHPRTALLTFNLAGTPYDLLAAVLSAEHGIGIRHGCFCAHPLMVRLLRVDDDEVGRLMREVRAGHHPNLPGRRA